MSMSSNQLYVIFRGSHTDWYIPVKDTNEGMGWRLFIKNWAAGYKVDITSVLKPHINGKIEEFPKNYFNSMINSLKDIMR